MPKPGHKDKEYDADDLKRGHRHRSQKRMKSKIAKDGYDYYAILGFMGLKDKEKSALKSKDIARAYNKKLHEYHPDYLPKGLDKSEIKQKRAMFKLIQEAGEILTNKSKRKAYDLENSVRESSGFLNQRSSFEDFMAMQEKNNTDEARARAKLDFEKGMDELEKKHGASKLGHTAISKKDANRKLEDLMQQRDIEELELKPQRMFGEGQEFDRMAFMKAFEKDKIKRSKKKGRGNDLVPYDNIGAFNDAGPGFNVNDDYGGLYAGDDGFGGNNAFGKLDGGSSDEGSDVESVNSDDIDTRYFGDGTQDNTDVEAALKKIMAERENEDELYEDEGFDGFKSAMHDKFGVSAGLGFMVGDKRGGEQVRKKTVKQISADDVDAYKKLIGYESDSEESDADSDDYKI